MKERVFTPLEPFCRGGNLYFVGTKEENCHVIRTSKGLLMIDVGSEGNLPAVLDGMKKMDLALKDLKLVLLSHWHGDHSGGVPALRRECERAGGAFRVLIGERDEASLPREYGFSADGVLRDGEVVTLGKTSVRCVASPGHTAGTMSFFFDLETGGKTIVCGMFGGAGTNQLRADFLEKRGISRLMRREYMHTLDRLSQEKVDQLVGNHSWNDHIPDTYALWKERGFDETDNPFIDPARWGKFLEKCRKNLQAVVREESVSRFVNYAHRGRSDDYHGNTMPAFLAGAASGANGMETDIRRTADGKLILFHDKDLTGLGEPDLLISELTFDEIDSRMKAAWGEEYGLVTAEEYVRAFGQKLRLALELKADGIEEETAALAVRYSTRENVTFTAFSIERLSRIHAILPEWHLGYLVKRGAFEGIEEDLFRRGIEEICPYAEDVTPERVDAWHNGGFTVRAWGVKNEAAMIRLVEAGVDGMTVNFPQKLAAYLSDRAEKEEKE